MFIDIVKNYFKGDIEIVEQWGINSAIILFDNKYYYATYKYKDLPKKVSGKYNIDAVICYNSNIPKKIHPTLINCKFILKNDIIDEPNHNTKRTKYSTFEKIKHSLIERKFVYPSPDDQILFNLIKRVIITYQSDLLEENEIQKYESLPGWQWDYFRLTKKGRTYEEYYYKKLNDPKIKDETLEKKIQNEHYMCKLTPYFRFKFRSIGVIK